MRLLKLHDDDNVSIVVKPRVGESSVPRGHKVANRPIYRGEDVLKYGQVIGKATRDIGIGEHVHVNNCSVAEAVGRSAEAPRKGQTRAAMPRSFDGFVRRDGRVGTRNYVGIVSTVSCSATVVAKVAEIANKCQIEHFKNIDGFVPITHGSGCGMAGGNDLGLVTLRRTLKGYASHPNFGGVLVIGLGCEVNSIKHYIEKHNDSREVLTIQASGGTKSTIREALNRLEHLAEEADRSTRSPCSIDKLVLGLQCGGSDAFSALTSNPALGVASDILVASGGCSILAETPEIVGAEHLMYARMRDPECEKLADILQWWKTYTAINGVSVINNPSPGNLNGGLTTILEKSLGAVAKSGCSPFCSVVRYAEPIRECGLTFMDSPGYDPVSVTGQIASGANVIAFTTGRGSCFGSKPTPTIKLSSNTELYESMPDDIDLDCGEIISNGSSVELVGQAIMDLIIDVASGQRSKSEINGFGNLEFEPWRLGAVL